MRVEKKTINFGPKEIRGLKKTIQILSRDDLLEPHIKPVLHFLSKRFMSQSALSEEIITELIRLTDENPELVIDLGRSAVLNIQVINKILIDTGNPTKTTFEQVTRIETYWESLMLLRFPAFLLAKGKVAFDQLSEKTAILRQLKRFPLSSQERENLRIIRNLSAHNFIVRQKCFVVKSERGLEIEIPFTEVENLQKKIDHVFSWWMTVFLVAPWACPKFGLLFLTGLLSEIETIKNDLPSWYKEITYLAPQLLDVNKKPTKARGPKIKSDDVQGSKEERYEKELEKYTLIFGKKAFAYVRKIEEYYAQTLSKIATDKNSQLVSKVHKYFAEMAANKTF